MSETFTPNIYIFCLIFKGPVYIYICFIGMNIFATVILTVRLIIEDQFHSCGHVSEDVQREDDDDKEGTEVTEAVHD